MLLRIRFTDAFYDITSCGDCREAIYEDDQDGEMFLEVLGNVIEQAIGAAVHTA